MIQNNNIFSKKTHNLAKFSQIEKTIFTQQQLTKKNM
jgi:hypothetical protein